MRDSHHDGDILKRANCARAFHWSVLLLAMPMMAGTAAAAEEPSVERGAYLSIAADCAGCHTGDEDEAPEYAGGRGIESPFGAIYAPNITPDPETGIGDWAYEDFEAALRQGVGKGGDYLYPAMPYVSYTKMTDRDVRDLWAYFQTVEPVRQEIPENTVPFPYNVNLGLAGWQAMFFEAGRFEEDPEKDEVWNRGAYLVEALGHCGSCHTPRNFGYAQDGEQELAGSKIQHWYAPNIGGGRFSTIKDWSNEDLEAYLKTGKRNDDNFVAGPMAEVIEMSLSKLEDADIEAIAVYLKDSPPMEPGSPVEVTEISEDERERGRELFALNCLGCHQANGEGVEGIAPSLVENDLVTAVEPNNAIMVVLQGIAPKGEWGAMPSFADALSSTDIAAIVNYMRTSWLNDAGAEATPTTVRALKIAAYESGEVGQPAAICPNVSADRFDPETFDALAELSSHEDEAAIRSIVEGYKERHGDLEPAEALTALYAMRCRQVIDASGSRRDGLHALSGFSGTVADTLEN